MITVRTKRKWQLLKGHVMSIITIKKWSIASALLLLMGSTTPAATLYVNCGGKVGLTSISAAIKVLQGSESHGPNTINVSGACNENVLIKNMDRLTLNAVSGASILDASNGNDDVINVNNSYGFTLKGFSITAVNANNDGVSCYYGSSCTLIGNTLQGGFDGVGVYPTATAIIVGGSLSGNINGLNARGDVIAAGVMIQGNSVGALVQDGGKVVFHTADPQYDGVDLSLPAVIQDNAQQGIQILRGGSVRCQGCTITSNQAAGISLDLSASMLVGNYFFNSGVVVGSTITRNTGPGVLVGDLSSATFQGTASNITGNGQPDISCVGPTSVTRRAVATVGAAHTNCTN
jgi:hypothetical protein